MRTANAKQTKESLQLFALSVLQIMENTEEWNSDMMDDISDIAMNLNLAKQDNFGYFMSNVKTK